MEIMDKQTDNLEELLDEQHRRVHLLKGTTILMKGRRNIKDELEEMHDKVLKISGGIESMRKSLDEMKKQNISLKELSSLIEALDKKIVCQEENVPPNVMRDYAVSVTQLKGQKTPKNSYSNSNIEEQEAIGDCKRTLFTEPEICLTISFITMEEFQNIPKYIINRQPLETINNLINAINQTLIAKYTILSAGKSAAQKKGEINLYLHYKKQELDFTKENGHHYFFTAEDFYKQTKTKIDKTKLTLLTALRHCKRLLYSMLQTESISTLSGPEDDIDDLDGSIVWSQEEPLSSSEILELSVQEKKKNSSTAFCRLCAGQTNNPIYIYSELGESMKLADKISTCLSVKIKKTDPLPKQLCLTCVDKINWCDEFDTQCIKAEDTLLAMLREKQSFDGCNHDQIMSDRQCCPLCMEGYMSVCEDLTFQDVNDAELYGSDVILESSDEEGIFNDAKVILEKADEGSENDSIVLQCLGNKQKYLKCRACMNLYHSKETLDGHKCKPNIHSTTKPYKCLICNAMFTFEERLNFHMQFHKDAKVLYCEVCKITFGKELKLFYHYKRYHCKNVNVSCLQCGKLFGDQETLRMHVCVDGKNRPHICEVCNKGFSDGYTLKRHIVTHLPEKPYKCSQCSKSFTQKSRLNKHVATHCIVIENNQTVWKCVQCGEAFVSCDDADVHCKAHKDRITLIEELSTSKLYHCEFCNSHFTDVDSVKAHQNRHVVEKPYTCNACGTIYKSFTEAVLHWKEHARLFKVLVVFLCDVCDKDTKELSLLYKHKRKRHNYTSRSSESGDTKFLCELCGNIFDRAKDIQDHSRNQCSKFPCDICGNLLPTVNSLNAHKRRHNGLRPYVCNICGKSYTQSSHMWTHKRFHMGVKPYACEYCDQRFTIKPDLADHTRKKHTRERPFKCDVCNKAFLTGSVFYQHRLIHRGDRRYKCHYCEKAFTRTEALNNHIKIHTGEKPHACDVCGRCFRQKGDMRKHRRTQHTSKKDAL